MSFSHAAVYEVEAVCATPLRTGGADGDTEQVLRRRDGAAFLQGTSLAGAMRAWLEEQPEFFLAERLFGGQERTGHLIVSDALFDRGAEQYTRPRLRIDPATAAAAVNPKTGKVDGKFDVAHMGTGSRLRFTLVWQGGAEEEDRELDAVERVLSAVNAGEIRLGAQKSNGFGRLTLTARRRRFDLNSPADRQAWLADEWTGQPLTLPVLAASRRVTFTVTGRAGSILVKDAPVVRPDGDEGRARTYTPNLSEGGQALLPGSSVKGAVRARAAYIAKVLGLEESLVEGYFGRPAREGDNGLPGQVFFEDAALIGPKQKISRIRIDRFTGGVQRQGLFTEEPLGCEVKLNITAPEEPVLCALLVYALRDLGLGLYSLGSGWAIGRGGIRVDEIRAFAPDQRQAALRFDGQSMIREDTKGLLREWLNALEEVRHV